MALTQLRLAGFGGQGVIMMGMIIGKAATKCKNMNATMTQSFGPEARGGACSAGVLIDTDPILYPYVLEADVLVAMNREAYEKYIPTLKDGGVLLYENELVNADNLADSVKSYGIPATRMAEELGRKMVANIVMVGFVTAMTEILPDDCVRDTVRESVPKGTVNLNMTAFKKGLEFGNNL